MLVCSKCDGECLRDKTGGFVLSKYCPYCGREMSTESDAKKSEIPDPCPNCYEAWVYASDGDYYSGYESKGYRMNCRCGYAWNTSPWANTRKEAVKRWNDGEK